MDKPPIEKTRPDGSIDAIFAKAAQFDVEEELWTPQDFGLAFGLHSKAHTNSISCILPNDGNRSAIRITPHQNSIKVYFRPHNLGKLDGFERIQIEEILEGKRLFWLTSEQLSELVNSFQGLLK